MYRAGQQSSPPKIEKPLEEEAAPGQVVESKVASPIGIALVLLGMLAVVVILGFMGTH